jgi:hypothetical protein
MLEAYLGGNGGLIRYSAIIKRLKEQGDHELAAKTKEEMEGAGRTCVKHGLLEDPIIGLDMVHKRLVVACPWCSGDVVLATWEAQGEGAQDDGQE